MSRDNNLQDEAKAFSSRIEERAQAGYIPDLRRMQRNEYFYQSYWRDPHFADLVMGETVRIFLGWLREYSQAGATILDVGCGPGYVSLELAREGYHVTGIDVAESAIQIARETLVDNPYKDGFGSLEYHAIPFEQASGTYDVVLFSGSLHHFDDPAGVVKRAAEMLNPGGLIICHEPMRDQWDEAAAAQTALIRMLLMLTGFWYEQPDEVDTHHNIDKLKAYIEDVHTEYVQERDKREGLQSPQDNASASEAILAALQAHVTELEYRPGFAYLYRMLGGLRGEDETVFNIADFLAAYEKLALREGYLKPSTFLFVGRVHKL